MASGGSEEALAGSLVGLAGVVTLAVLVFLAWLAVRVLNCVITAFSLSPRSRPLWGSLGVWVAGLVLAAATQLAFFGVVAWLGFLSLVICARAVVLTHQAAFEQEYGGQDYIHEVLTEWWPKAA